MRNNRHAFTLIELLVVVGIIALLVSILMPSLKKARAQTRRAACAANLHQVGLAMMSYMHDSRDRMPFASYMPSFNPAPVSSPCRATLSPPDCDPIFLSDLLRPHLSKAQSRGDLPVLRCPDDRPESLDDSDKRQDSTAPPIAYSKLSYFESERSSYDYRWSLAGLTPTEFALRASNPNLPQYTEFWHRHSQAQVNISPATIYFSRDYNNFHGKAGTNGARRYLYIDGHVSDYEN